MGRATVKKPVGVDGNRHTIGSEGIVRNRLVCLSCVDSEELAIRWRRELALESGVAADLGRSTVEICTQGEYRWVDGAVCDLKPALARARTGVVSLPPGVSLPTPTHRQHAETRIQVRNESTLAAARELVAQGRRPLALSFANARVPGGGFLAGAVAQEEALCRSSALFTTLLNDPMYAWHQEREQDDATDWAILSPEVPVFRDDAGKLLREPWHCGFLTCAAPYAHDVGQPRSGDLLQGRIQRVLAIAEAYGYDTLVLGAWGCGEFGNDIWRTARDFRSALETEFAGAFAVAWFAIADWSPERRFLGPFRERFLPDGGGGSR